MTNSTKSPTSSKNAFQDIFEIDVVEADVIPEEEPEELD